MRTHDQLIKKLLRRLRVRAEVERIEREESALLAAFHRWYAAFDVNAWDRQFEAHVKAGRLDVLTDKVLCAHIAGQSKPL